MNRKGSAQDVLLIMGLMFAFGVAFLVAHYATGEIYTAMLANPQINESAVTVDVLEAGLEVDDKLDYWTMAVFFGLIIALIVTAWFVSGNPLFIGVYVIVIIIAVVVSMGLSNGWEELSQNPKLIGSTNSLPFTNHVLLYLPYYTAVLGMLGIIVLFAKPFFRPGGDLQ